MLTPNGVFTGTKMFSCKNIVCLCLYQSTFLIVVESGCSQPFMIAMATRALAVRPSVLLTDKLSSIYQDFSCDPWCGYH